MQQFRDTTRPGPPHQQSYLPCLPPEAVAGARSDEGNSKPLQCSLVTALAAELKPFFKVWETFRIQAQTAVRNKQSGLNGAKFLACLIPCIFINSSCGLFSHAAMFKRYSSKDIRNGNRLVDPVTSCFLSFLRVLGHLGTLRHWSCNGETESSLDIYDINLSHLRYDS